MLEKLISTFNLPTVAAQINCGFFLSTASSFIPTWNKLFLGVGGSFLNIFDGAISAPFNVFKRNIGHEDAFIRKPVKLILESQL